MARPDDVRASLSLAANGGRVLAFVHGRRTGAEKCAAESVAVLWEVAGRSPSRSCPATELAGALVVASSDDAGAVHISKPVIA